MLVIVATSEAFCAKETNFWRAKASWHSFWVLSVAAITDVEKTREAMALENRILTKFLVFFLEKSTTLLKKI